MLTPLTTRRLPKLFMIACTVSPSPDADGAGLNVTGACLGPAGAGLTVAGAGLNVTGAGLNVAGG